MPNKPPMKMGHSPAEMSPYKMGHSPNEMGHSPNEMSPMKNQNKGYAKQERKDLIQDMPIDTRASSIINAGIRSRMGGQPQMGHSPAEMGHSPAQHKQERGHDHLSKTNIQYHEDSSKARAEYDKKQAMKK